ncbi:MAG TPA: STAS domain-containing protein [Solirubrobacteraceae bacterium]|nr:STAS domain-containing protein [Solirubrobacteraceae bacterium]
MSSVPEGVLPVDVEELTDDVRTLDLLARFALEARRCGYRVVIRGASPHLLELIELAGLSRALGIDPIRPDSTPSRC